MMVSIATSPQWKLTYQKDKHHYFVVVIVVIISVMITTLVLFFSIDSCGLNHLEILNDIDAYHTKNFDPNFCADLLDKIYLFNESCQPTVDIIDCG